jgi:hypothetical protein
MVGGGKSVWHQRSLWPDTTELCLDDKCVGKTVDGATDGEVRSETGRKGLFHQHDGGLASFRSRATLHPDLSESARRPLSPPKAQESFKKQHLGIITVKQRHAHRGDDNGQGYVLSWEFSLRLPMTSGIDKYWRD